MKRVLLLALGLWWCLPSPGQIAIQHSGTHSEDFDGLGTTAPATLPTHWKIDGLLAVRTLGTYAAADTQTFYRGGNNLGKGVTPGLYNFGAGDSTTATDRTAGWSPHVDGPQSGNLYAHFRNTGTVSITSLDIAYSVEKYRKAKADYYVQLYYSTDGSSWTSAGATFLTNFAADSNTDGYPSAPGETVAVSATLTPTAAIPVSGDLYLAWNFSVTVAATAKDGMAIGIDGFSLNNVLPVELTAFEAVLDGDAVTLRWETASETNNAGFSVEHHAGDAWQAIGWRDGQGTTAASQRYTFRHKDLAPGTHRFRLKQIDYDGAFDYSPEVEVSVGVPGAFRMTPPYPNPFTGQTQLALSVARRQPIEVAVYDVRGRRVARLFAGTMEAGTTRALVFDAAALPGGLYLIRATGAYFRDARLVMRVR